MRQLSISRGNPHIFVCVHTSDTTSTTTRRLAYTRDTIDSPGGESKGVVVRRATRTSWRGAAAIVSDALLMEAPKHTHARQLFRKISKRSCRFTFLHDPTRARYLIHFHETVTIKLYKPLVFLPIKWTNQNGHMQPESNNGTSSGNVELHRACPALAAVAPRRPSASGLYRSRRARRGDVHIYIRCCERAFVGRSIARAVERRGIATWRIRFRSLAVHRSAPSPS